MKRLPLGSVGRAVVHASTIPVLVVRGAASTEPKEEFRVLVACDATEASKHARQVLKKINWPANTVGRVITVVESLAEGNLPAWLEEQLRQADFDMAPDAAEAAHLVSHVDEHRQHILEEAAGWCAELPAPFQQHEPIVAQGHASKEILKAIEAEKIDLVVLGSRGRGPLKRLFVGSTSEHLLARAACSILIARQHERP